MNTFMTVEVLEWATATTDVAALWHIYSRSFSLACFILDRDMKIFHSVLFFLWNAICNGNFDYSEGKASQILSMTTLELGQGHWQKGSGKLTRCKLMGRFEGGGGSMNVCFVLISSGFNSRSMSSSTSLPFVSPRSYHSTVTDRCCGFIFETIAEWTRPKNE